MADLGDEFTTFLSNSWNSITSPAQTVSEVGEYLAPLVPGSNLGTVTGGPSGQGVSAANVVGYQSSAQKQSQVQQEASSLQEAGASPEAAQQQAQQDVTDVYKQAGVDPSQNPFNPDNWPPLNLDYAIWALGLIGGTAALQLPVIGHYGWVLIAIALIGAVGEYLGYWSLGISYSFQPSGT